MQVDPQGKRVKLQLRVESLSEDEKSTSESMEAGFWVGFYDFPMIDNLRLSHDQRCAVILKAFNEGESAQISLLYFPGCYASLKEKPYYQDIVQHLVASSKKLKQ